MLDPRIYRMGFVAVSVAAVLLLFSLRDQQGPLTATLAPEAFNGQNASVMTGNLARDYPNRRPGSTGDNALAGAVAQSLQRHGFAISTSSFSGRTVDGTRMLETVTGVRTGLSSGAIVVLAHRDASTSPATADLSGTATLIELGRVLSGETQHRTIVLASTSGSAGAAGAAHLAASIGVPIDAVIVLGDLAGAKVRAPVVVPWSDGQNVAPPVLRNTIGAAIGAQAGLRPGGTSLGGQLAHLAFPLTLSEQGPFGARGTPAVGLSVSGENGPGPNEVPSPDRITALGRAVLQTINALDSGGGIPTASAYLLYNGKVVPAWAVRLFVLALILPVLGATIDGLARARRRGHSITGGVAWVAASAFPFALAVVIIVGARLTNLLAAAPPGPVGAGVIPLHGAGVALMAALAVAVVLSFAAVRRLRSDADDGTGVACLLVMCIVALVIWIENPFAAVLLIAALHLWMWVLDSELRLPRSVKGALLLAGLAPPLLVIVYYALALGLSPMGVLWNGVLLIAGGHIGLLTALEWSLLAGCAVSAGAIARRPAGESHAGEMPVTVRGPVTYAGPGSLGGTESALRR